MVYELKTERESSCTTQTLKVVDLAGQRFVVQSQNDTLRFYLYDDHSPFLNLAKVLQFPHKVEVMATIQALPKVQTLLGVQSQELLRVKGQNILVYSNGVIYLVTVADSSFKESSIVLLEIKPGLQQRLESGPGLVCYQNGTHNVALLHKLHGFLTFIDLGQMNGKNSKKRRKTSTPLSWTTAIGSTVVKDICWLQLHQMELALLGRDMEFRYSLYIYEIDMDAGLIKSKTLKHQFRDAPSLLFSAAGGVCVASGIMFSFFPKYQPIDHTGKCDILRNQYSSRAVLDFSENNPEYQSMTWLAHCIVDEEEDVSKDTITERHLLVSDGGHTVMVYLQVNNKAMQTNIFGFEYVDLGKTTIASDLVHIESNIFFVSSRLSQSVLFRVLPSKPHIHIFGYILVTPPILDISIEQENSSMVVAQGGFYSGELVLRSNRKVDVKKVPLPYLALLAEYKGITRNGLKFTATAFDKSHDYILKLDDEPKIENVGSHDVQLLGSISTRTASGALVSVSSNLLSYDLECLELPDLVDPMSIQTVEGKGHTDIVVALSTNELFLVRYGGELEFVLKQKVPFTDPLSVAIFSVSKGPHPVVMAVSSKGECYQSIGKETKILLLPPVKGWVRVKCCGARNPTLLLLGSTNVWVLSKQTDLNSVKATLVYTSEERISDCLIVGDERDGTLVLFHGTTTISVVDYHTLHHEEKVVTKYYSENTFLRAVKLTQTNYLVTIELEMNIEGNDPSRRTLLKLFDALNLTLRLTFVPKSNSYHADLCQVFIPEESKSFTKQPVFVAANNASASLQTYLVRDDTIVLHSEMPYRKLVAVNAHGNRSAIRAVHQVKFKDGNLILMGDGIVRLLLECSNGDISWVVENIQTARFAIGYEELHGIEIIADAVEGILVSHFGENRYLQSFKVDPFKPFFLTALAAIKSKNLILFGDSNGNLGGLHIERKEGMEVLVSIVFATNIGETINVIRAHNGDDPFFAIGTVNGAIYTLQELGSHSDNVGLLVDRKTFPWRFDDEEIGQFEVTRS
ncbi:CIC11C00000004256 [Sungouiella intermedia]|uniref:CIC11C00000004256 n=1 Tax=Sungouiella intermedia TaxID=45354 RepID=A0A1L0BF62_9ASCO|nr:CIC11C00000004256 [[Candida] intermedia]